MFCWFIVVVFRVFGRLVCYTLFGLFILGFGFVWFWFWDWLCFLFCCRYDGFCFDLCLGLVGFLVCFVGLFVLLVCLLFVCFCAFVLNGDFVVDSWCVVVLVVVGLCALISLYCYCLWFCAFAFWFAVLILVLIAVGGFDVCCSGLGISGFDFVVL